MKRPALVLHLTAVAFLLQSAASAPTASPPASDASSKQASGIAPVLLISFDGFRASYLDAQPRESLPNLNAFWEGGVRASIVPRFVSKTFPNHYSLVTGLLEQNHGVVGKEELAAMCGSVPASPNDVYTRIVSPKKEPQPFFQAEKNISR